MLDPGAIRSIVNRYIDMMCASDIEGIMALYADDATAEDPVGGHIHEGSEAIASFYSFAAPALQVELVGPVCVAANNCAFLLLAKLTMDGTTQFLDATDVLSFNDEGKISSMKAYWNMEDVRTSP